MDGQHSFGETLGTGCWAEADGRVTVASYSRPHVRDAGTRAFAMADRLTHANLEESPHAAHASPAKGLQGVRLDRETVREAARGPLLEKIRVRAETVVGPEAGDAVTPRVHSRLVEALPLVGGRVPAAADLRGAA